MSVNVYLTVNTISGYTARQERLNGIDYLVAPAVLLVEGVHHGSAGPVFYPANELQAFVGAWDGRPVTLGHPEIEGQPIGASTPDALEQFYLGMLMGTTYDPDGSRLRSEVWVDVARVRRLAPEVLEALKNGDPLEISTGLWFEAQGDGGIWGNEPFETTATRFRPDHLALLPGQVGACSISDGCGLRANKEEEGGGVGDNGPDTRLEVGNMVNEKGTWDRFVDFIKNEPESKEVMVARMLESLAVNQPGMVSTVRALQSQLDAMDREVPNGFLTHWLEEAFDDGTFIMRQSGPEGDKFFKGAFESTEESVEIMGNDFTEVREKKEFVEVSNEEDGGPQETKITDKEEGNVSNGTDARKTLVDNLIACGKTVFNETHRDGLMAMDEVALSQLKAKEEQPAPAPAVAGNAVPEPPKTMEEALALIPEEFRGPIEAGIETANKRKEEAVKNIMAAAPKGAFAEADLMAKNLSEVEAIESLVKTNKEEDGDGTGEAPEGNESQGADFSGKAPAHTAAPAGNEQGAEPLGRPIG